MTDLLLDHASPGATTCVIVGDFDVDGAAAELRAFRAVLWFVDSESAARAPRTFGSAPPEIMLLENTPAAAVAPALDRFIVRDGRHLPHLWITKDVAARNVAAYEFVIGEIQTVFERTHRARRTRQEEGFLWQKQFFINLPDFVTRRVPNSWAGALRGLPAFVCGAGPSLDVSAARLAAIADEGVVFAADSALRTLARYGVQADFAISVDATKPPEKCLAADTDPARVVLAGISPPAWREVVHRDRIQFLSSRHLTEDWLAARGLSRTPLAVAENCGSTALELARFLGCAPIYLFGLDLAADAANPARRHTEDSDPTIQRGSGFARGDGREMPLVPGNYTESVPTFLFGEWRALDARLATWPENLVINVNDRGARLGNTTLVHPQKFEFQSPRAPREKRSALWHLPSPESRTDEATRAALAEIGAAGAHAAHVVVPLRAALDLHGPEGVVAELRRLFANETFARALGSFSLKLMPHLAPPIEGDAQFWSTLLDELEELGCLAESVYEAPVGS